MPDRSNLKNCLLWPTATPSVSLPLFLCIPSLGSGILLRNGNVPILVASFVRSWAIDQQTLLAACPLLNRTMEDKYSLSVCICLCLSCSVFLCVCLSVHACMHVCMCVYEYVFKIFSFLWFNEKFPPLLSLPPWTQWTIISHVPIPLLSPHEAIDPPRDTRLNIPLHHHNACWIGMTALLGLYCSVLIFRPSINSAIPQGNSQWKQVKDLGFGALWLTRGWCFESWYPSRKYHII